MMVKGHRDLDQPLQKLALRFGRLPPDILKRLVGFKELGSIEQPDALAKKTIQVAVGTLLHGNRLTVCLMAWVRGRGRETARVPGKLGFSTLGLILTGCCESQYANQHTLKPMSVSDISPASRWYWLPLSSPFFPTSRRSFHTPRPSAL